MISGLILSHYCSIFLDDEKNCKKSKILDYFKTKTAKMDNKIVEKNCNNPTISVVDVLTPCEYTNVLMF